MKLFYSRNKRTNKAKKNIIASFFVKGLSILSSFLIVPVTLNYLDNEDFGIWVTISSFLVWAGFFDIGLGNGLRNKLAESFAKNDLIESKKYVSTTYFLLSLISLLIFFVFIVLNKFLDWSVILNTKNITNNELQLLALVVFGFFFLRFVLKLVGVVLLADQRPAMNSLLIPLGDLVGLTIIYFISLSSNQGSLFLVGLVYSISPIVVFIFASVYFYSFEYKSIVPSLKYIEIKYARSVLSLGLGFFIIQLSTLTLFQSSNIIVSYLFGPEEVTNYYIAYRYFSIILLLMTIVITPFWSAFTDAWTNNEIDWIKNTISKLLKIWFLLVLLSIILFFSSENFFKIWLGAEKYKSIVIKIDLKLALTTFFLLFSFGGIFNMFINGVGKIKIQIIFLTIGVLLYFPLVYLFVKVLNMGTESVVIALIIANFYTPIIAPIQYRKLIYNRANGIWNE